MNNSLAVVSLEKEVGKSTFALNIASLISSSLNKVFLLDLDFKNGGLTKILGLNSLPIGMYELSSEEVSLRDAAYEHPLGFNIVPNFGKDNNYSVATLKKNIKSGFTDNFLVFDTNSGKGLLGALEVADNFVIISDLSHDSINSIKQLSNIIGNNSKTTLGVVLNRVKKSYSKQDLEEMEKLLGLKILASIPEHKHISKSNKYNQPVSYIYKKGLPLNTFKQVVDKLNSQVYITHSKSD
jgi:septum site-determining protein MinD